MIRKQALGLLPRVRRSGGGWLLTQYLRPLCRSHRGSGGKAQTGKRDGAERLKTTRARAMERRRLAASTVRGGAKTPANAAARAHKKIPSPFVLADGILGMQAMARRARIELTTSGLEDLCSIQLSYRRNRPGPDYNRSSPARQNAAGTFGVRPVAGKARTSRGTLRPRLHSTRRTKPDARGLRNSASGNAR